MSIQKTVGSLGTIATFAFMGFITLGASRTKAIKSGESVDFSAPPAIKALSIVLPAGAFLAFVLVLLLKPFDYGWFIILFAGVLGLFGVPSDLKVTDDGVYEKFWWRPARTILWKDVQSINYNTSSGSIKLRSINGKTIAHSRLNRDQYEFERICRMHVKSHNH